MCRLNIPSLLYILLILSGPLSSASATDYYFSDCATGGSGTIGDPYCLDPDGDGIKQSFEYLMNGSVPDVVAGDVVYLCAGPCNNTGTATYHLDSTGTTAQGFRYVIDPQVSGTQANPITIRTYPGETVILSGDSNANGVYDATEVDTLLTSDAGAGGTSWYVWQGIIFERTWHIAINLRGGTDNWTFDNIEVRFLGLLWGGGNYDDVGCDGGSPSHAIKIANATGNFTVRNSIFHHICGFGHRNTVNPDLVLGIFENNEYYNTGNVNNEFLGGNTVWRNNFIHDVRGGFSVEQDMRNVTIEDNTFACLGVYKALSDWSCGVAIGINNGNLGGGSFSTKNITIRRNIIYGATHGIANGPNRGWWFSGISFTAINNTEPLNSVIENNFVMHVQAPFDFVQNAGIYVSTTRPVTVQNNTVYDSFYGIVVSGAAHIIRNNLVVQAYSYGRNRNKVEILVDSTAAGSTLENNNMHYGDHSDPVLQIGETTYNCTDTFPGVGNFCAATTFINTSGPKDTWDLHLIATDTVNQDSGTSAIGGVTDDIDKQSRLGLVDVGADEIVTIPQPPANLRIVATIPPPLPAQAFYAAPNGTSEGNGSLSNPWDLTTAFLPGMVSPGGTLLLREGNYDNVPDGSEVAGTESAPVVVRSAPDEWAVFKLHSSWRPSGEWVIYRDFEIAGETGTRISQFPNDRATDLNRTPFIPQGSHQKYINLVIHDLLANGMGAVGGQYPNIEIYGCIIYYNGWIALGYPLPQIRRTHGHGLYLQNGTPESLDPLQKLAENNIIWGNAHTGIQLFGSSGLVNNVRIEGNTIWANGSSAITASSGEPMRDIVVANNAVYNANIRMGNRLRRDRNLTIVDNILTGGLFALQVQGWDTVVVQGNFIWAPVLSSHFIAPDPWDVTRTTWNKNSYIEGGSNGAARQAQFRLADGENRVYADWQSRTGFDTTSTYTVTPTQLPDTTMIRINPNIYEEGRAHITIFNWNQHETISVDFSSFMQVGAAYEVYSAYDYLAGPLQIGVYIGTPVSLSMTSQNVATPIGTGFPISVMPSQEFGVFIVQAQR